MFRRNTSADYTDEEFEKIIAPQLNKCNKFLEEKLIPEYCAYDVVTTYEMNSYSDESFNVFLNSSIDIFNIQIQNMNKLKASVIKILKNKYGYELVDKIPFDLIKSTKKEPSKC